jgi:hypothetical protein
MKKIFLLLVSIAFGLNGYAQDSSIFDKFEDYDEVTTIVVTQQAFKMLQKVSSDSEEGVEFQKLISGLEDLKIFTTEDTKTADEMRATFDKYLKSKKLSELMRIKDKDANVRIYIREGKDEDHVSEFLMIVDEMNVKVNHKGRGAQEVVIISLTGDIDLNNISKITTNMNIPAGEYLEKAEKK